MKNYFGQFRELVISFLARSQKISGALHRVVVNKKNHYLHPDFSENLDVTTLEKLNLKLRIEKALASNEVVFPIPKIFSRQFSQCLLVVPDSFLNEKSHVGKGFTPVVLALIEMLKTHFPNLLVLSVPEVTHKNFEVKTKEILKKLYEIEFNTENSFCIFFSTTYLSQKCGINEILPVIKDKITFLVGYLTSTGTTPSSTKFSVQKLEGLNLLIDYNPKSDFLLNYNEHIPIVHIPWVTTNVIYDNNTFTPSVFFSGLLKHNRLAWIIAINQILRTLNIKSTFKLYSPAGIRFKIQNFKKRNSLHTSLRNNLFGLVLLNREPGKNDGLIGSFWDVFYSGALPLVQFEGSDYKLCEYLKPYRDYLPFSSLKEFKVMIEVLCENPKLITDLKKINTNRRNKDINTHWIGLALYKMIQQEGTR